jgi:archaellum biogenesis protein FlaJ (TadC family)
MKKSFELRKSIKEVKYTKILLWASFIVSIIFAGSIFKRGNTEDLIFLPILPVFAAIAYFLNILEMRNQKNQHNAVIEEIKEDAREKLNQLLLERAELGWSDVDLAEFAQRAEELLEKESSFKIK